MEHNKHNKPSQASTNECKYCLRNKELRFGGCFDCADMESIFFDRTDMWDNDYSDWTKGEILAHIIRTSMNMENK